MTVARESDTARMLVLHIHYRRCGVCWKCVLVFTEARIESENGTPTQPVQWCETPERCRMRAEAGRVTMPAR